MPSEFLVKSNRCAISPPLGAISGLAMSGLLSLVLSGCQNLTAFPAEQASGHGKVNSAITATQVPEISGLANSQLLPGHFWAINDSGNSAEVYRIDANLNLVQTVRLSLSNRDWEDMAAFSDQGTAWLVIAETGDNLLRHSQYALHFFQEKHLLTHTDGLISADKSIHFRFENGPQNCEAMAIDVQSRKILLISKSQIRQKFTVYLSMQRRAPDCHSQAYCQPVYFSRHTIQRIDRGVDRS